MHGARDWTPLDAALLRRWPLPEVPDDADKEVRGRILVVAGSREIPGAALLAGTAALRAGAGKLVIATGRSVATQLALAVPEARVIGLRESDAGSFALDGLPLLDASLDSADAVLIGPGLVDEAGTSRFVAALLARGVKAPIVLDALAMCVVKQGHPLSPQVLMTPHAGEMAGLTGLHKQSVVDDPEGAVVHALNAWNAVVALKGATTLVAEPGGRGWRHEAGHPGLATSGSGDVLAGLIAGLAARGAPLGQAACWGVVLHALAGRELARRKGEVGYLAREIANEIPAMLESVRA